MDRSRRLRAVAWALGLGGALASAVALGWTIAIGLYVPLAIINVSLILLGALGALVASRAPATASAG